MKQKQKWKISPDQEIRFHLYAFAFTCCVAIILAVLVFTPIIGVTKWQ